MKMLEEHKRKIGDANMGKIPWNKGTKGLMGKNVIGIKKGHKMSEETKKKMSLWHKGRKLSESTKKKMRESQRGKLKPWQLGEKNHQWNGGTSFEPYSTDWKETLKRSIREKYNYICQVCNQYGNEVHHIDYDKKNCNVNNLIVLCNKCHSKTNHNRSYWKEYFQ